MVQMARASGLIADKSRVAIDAVNVSPALEFSFRLSDGDAAPSVAYVMVTDR